MSKIETDKKIPSDINRLMLKFFGTRHKPYNVILFKGGSLKQRELWILNYIKKDQSGMYIYLHSESENQSILCFTTKMLPVKTFEEAREEYIFSGLFPVIQGKTLVDIDNPISYQSHNHNRCLVM